MDDTPLIFVTFVAFVSALGGLWAMLDGRDTIPTFGFVIIMGVFFLAGLLPLLAASRKEREAIERRSGDKQD